MTLVERHKREREALFPNDWGAAWWYSVFKLIDCLTEILTLTYLTSNFSLIWLDTYTKDTDNG